MKKLIAIICAAAMIFALAACGSKSDTDYSGQTITGRITSIDGSKVSLQLGTLSSGGGDNNGAPPNAPSDTGNNQNSQTPPEKPSGESGSDNNQIPPDKPDGEGGGQPGGGQQFAEGDETATVDLKGVTITENGSEITASDLSEGEILSVTFGDDNKPASAEVVSENASGIDQGSSANTISADGSYSGETYSSTDDDENALRVDGATVSLDGITVDKSDGASSSTENGDFYGANAALLATNGATVNITNSTIKSSAQNGNGVFSYGSGTTVNISDSSISTTKDNSGGLQTTGGGTMNAENLSVTTEGNSSAAIRSDRGGGTVNVNGGSYTSSGYNSPAVYSTANISVSGATLTANNSEALVIEGANSIALSDCDVSGNMSSTNGASSDENVHNVMIYQSMSGDADVGTSTFTMSGGKLIGNNGDMFYITNTHSVIKLSGVDIINKDTGAYLMRVTGNSGSRGWGSAGSNGAEVEFTADGQVLSGNIIVDSISKLTMELKGSSSFTGTINIVDNAEGGSAVSDNAVVTIGSGCTWTLTGNCTVTSIVNNGTINFNGYTITLADGTVLS